VITIHNGRNTIVKLDKDSFIFDLKRPLTDEIRDGAEAYLTSDQQRKLQAAGFDDVSPRGDGSAWMAPLQENSKIRQIAQEFDEVGRVR
jgi:hypothetical protein